MTKEERTVWHVLFADLVRERRSPDFDVLVDVPLTSEPQRADLLLLRKHPGQVAPTRGKILRGLWPRLDSDSLAEFKSVARPVRRGDLIRLLGYGAQYHARHSARLTRDDLSLVLIVAQPTRGLVVEAGRLGWRLGEAERGYARLEAEPYRGWVVFLDQVERAERDEVLSPFFHRRIINSNSAQRWWRHRLMGPNRGIMKDDITKLAGYDEACRVVLASLPPARVSKMIAKLPAEMRERIQAKLAAQMPVEQRLAGLSLDERLAGLSLDERLAGLSADELEAFAAKLRRQAKRPARVQRRTTR